MKLELNSGLFSVYGPDLYWIFDGLCDWTEESENEWHEQNKWIPDNDYKKDLFGDTDVRKRNAEWKPGIYIADRAKVLDIIARYWLELFNERIADKGIKARARYTSSFSPKEYNFSGDLCEFSFTVSKKEVKRLAALCLADERFPEHLRKHYTSYDGFWSYCTNDPDVFRENASNMHGEQEYIRAVWQAVNFILFPEEQDTTDWNENFTAGACDKDFSGCLVFEEDTEGAA